MVMTSASSYFLAVTTCPRTAMVREARGIGRRKSDGQRGVRNADAGGTRAEDRKERAGWPVLYAAAADAGFQRGPGTSAVAHLRKSPAMRARGRIVRVSGPPLVCRRGVGVHDRGNCRLMMEGRP
jgi:hypothetical protein